MRETWRLLRSSPAPGAWNMALDEAILEAVVQWQSPPTLRLYAWDPPCLSLGYAQSFSDVDVETSTRLVGTWCAAQLEDARSSTRTNLPMPLLRPTTTRLSAEACLNRTAGLPLPWLKPCMI